MQTAGMSDGLCFASTQHEQVNTSGTVFFFLLSFAGECCCVSVHSFAVVML